MWPVLTKNSFRNSSATPSTPEIDRSFVQLQVLYSYHSRVTGSLTKSLYQWDFTKSPISTTKSHVSSNMKSGNVRSIFNSNHSQTNVLCPWGKAFHSTQLYKLKCSSWCGINYDWLVFYEHVCLIYLYSTSVTAGVEFQSCKSQKSGEVFSLSSNMLYSNLNLGFSSLIMTHKLTYRRPAYICKFI